MRCWLFALRCQRFVACPAEFDGLCALCVDCCLLFVVRCVSYVVCCLLCDVCCLFSVVYDSLCVDCRLSMFVCRLIINRVVRSLLIVQVLVCAWCFFFVRSSSFIVWC